MAFFSSGRSATRDLFRQRLPRITVRNAGRKDNSDPRSEIIRSVLYPSNRRSKDPSPVGSYRSDVYRALRAVVKNRTVHETIERAWLLHRRHVRKQREEEMEQKFQSMRRAMVELEKVDMRLAREANRPVDPTQRTEEEMKLASKLKGAARRALDARLPGLFPREMRPPTDTPPIGGWNHDWKPSTSRKS